MVYYIISTKFLKEWQAFSGYEDKGPSQAVGKGIITAKYSGP
jgi:hypothetical protein